MGDSGLHNVDSERGVVIDRHTGETAKIFTDVATDAEAAAGGPPSQDYAYGTGRSAFKRRLIAYTDTFFFFGTMMPR